MQHLKKIVIPECFYRGYGFKTGVIFPITTSGMTDFIIMLTDFIIMLTDFIIMLTDFIIIMTDFIIMLNSYIQINIESPFSPMPPVSSVFYDQRIKEGKEWSKKIVIDYTGSKL